MFCGNLNKWQMVLSAFLLQIYTDVYVFLLPADSHTLSLNFLLARLVVKSELFFPEMY